MPLGDCLLNVGAELEPPLTSEQTFRDQVRRYLSAIGNFASFQQATKWG